MQRWDENQGPEMAEPAGRADAARAMLLPGKVLFEERSVGRHAEDVVVQGVSVQLSHQHSSPKRARRNYKQDRRKPGEVGAAGKLGAAAGPFRAITSSRPRQDYTDPTNSFVNATRSGPWWEYTRREDWYSGGGDGGPWEREDLDDFGF